MKNRSVRSRSGSGLVILLIVFGAAPSAWARPEYAVKENMKCAACHVNPWGGGPRTVFGKVYGSRNLGLAKTSSSDLFYGDMRTIAFFPTVQNPVKGGAGVALMEAAASVNVPILQNSESGSELRGVATYNFAPLMVPGEPGVREAYLRYRPFSNDNQLLSYVMVGRFNAPFGLLTDEHRTYTRLETNMTLNDFEEGVAFSGDPLSSFHYDLALVNDFQQGGGGFDITNAQVQAIYGEILNLRWSPSSLPFFLGASENFERTIAIPSPSAFSLYGALSFDRLTNHVVHLSLLAETVFANNWNNMNANPQIGPFFIPGSDTGYQTALATAHSNGYYIWLRYTLFPSLDLIYKFDDLIPNGDAGGDYFVRHGLGFEYWINSNLILDCRAEKAFVGRPEIQNTNVFAAEDDVLAMLRLWL